MICETFDSFTPRSWVEIENVSTAITPNPKSYKVAVLHVVEFCPRVTFRTRPAL